MTSPVTAVVPGTGGDLMIEAGSWKLKLEVGLFLEYKIGHGRPA